MPHIKPSVLKKSPPQPLAGQACAQSAGWQGLGIGPSAVLPFCCLLLVAGVALPPHPTAWGGSPVVLPYAAVVGRAYLQTNRPTFRPVESRRTVTVPSGYIRYVPV